MNILNLLKEDHKKIKSLLKGIKSSSKRKDQFKALHTLVHGHSKAEEMTFYEPLKAVSNARPLALEGYEEHRVAGRLLKELALLSPEDERWAAKMSVLEEALNHHILEEEAAIFPAAKKVFNSEKLGALGEDFLNKKDALLQKPPTENSRWVSKRAESTKMNVKKLTKKQYGALDGTASY